MLNATPRRHIELSEIPPDRRGLLITQMSENYPICWVVFRACSYAHGVILPDSVSPKFSLLVAFIWRVSFDEACSIASRFSLKAGGWKPTALY